MHKKKKQSFIENIKEWYQGKYIPPRDNDPDSPLFIISPGHYEKPFLAKVLQVLIKFWLNHWKWIVGTILAIVALVLRICDNNK